MANSLRVKIAIAVISSAVLVAIPLMQTNFFAPIIIKRWSKLTWDDFKGIPQPFSSYEAAISSSIYLEFDSAQNRYVAYAGQNNIRSWAKRSEPGQEYELNHEQYHFNITELHARMLNEYILKNPDGNLDLYLLRLGSLKLDLAEMQNRYDEETDHSLIFDKQRLWEFRIDSLLIGNKGWITDHYSGAQVYMPYTTDSSKTIASQMPCRYYSNYRYGMELLLASYHASSIDREAVIESVLGNIPKRGHKLKAVKVDSAESFKLFVISEDTTSRTHYQLWSSAGQYLYNVKAVFPNNTIDTTGYSQIARSVLGSFQLVNTDQYWISQLLKTDPLIIKSRMLDERIDKSTPVDFCLSFGPESIAGFSRGPMFRDDGAMLIAYDNVVHPDSLHWRDVIIINDDAYTQQPTGHGQIYFVPAKNIPRTDYSVKFGYLLAQDSTHKCYEFHHAGFHVMSRKPNAVAQNGFDMK